MNSKKICNFFVSDSHLLTALLPHINEKILENKNVQLILQNDMTFIVKEYLNKIKSLNLEKKKILNLEWKKTNLEKITIKDKDMVIIIGEREYIEEVNKKVETNADIEEILECYRINDVKNINEILINYSLILDTEGIKSIQKNSQNAQKKKTIQTQI